MRFGFLACCALAVSAQSALAADEYPADLLTREEVSILKPITQWSIDYGENKCRISRLFGTQDAPHLLYMEQAAPGHFFALAIAGSELGKVQRDSVLKLGLAEDQIAREISGLTADFGQIGRGVIKKDARLREATPLKEGEVRWLTGRLDPKEGAAIKRIVLARRNKAVVFETGALDVAADAMNACTSDLLAHWGLDPEQHKQFRAAKILNIDAIVKRIFNTYPRRAALQDEKGDVSTRLIVEADGTVSDCLIEGLTANEALKPELCKILRGASFEPAQGADGQPIRSFYIVPVSYRLF